jgi:hypothetical protein
MLVRTQYVSVGGGGFGQGVASSSSHYVSGLLRATILACDSLVYTLPSLRAPHSLAVPPSLLGAFGSLRPLPTGSQARVSDRRTFQLYLLWSCGEGSAARLLP